MTTFKILGVFVSFLKL